MPQHPNRRVDPQIILADQTALAAVENLPNYSPANPAFSKEALVQTRQKMESARLAVLHAENALKEARDNATEAEWNFHNAMLGMKTQVIAQYGADSHQVNALGLKKKSERKRPSSRLRVMGMAARPTGQANSEV